jgi:hypothetical protein
MFSATSWLKAAFTSLGMAFSAAEEESMVVVVVD